MVELLLEKNDFRCILDNVPPDITIIMTLPSEQEGDVPSKRPKLTADQEAASVTATTKC